MLLLLPPLFVCLFVCFTPTVPLYVYHQVLLKLPSSWDTRAVSSSDSEKVEEVMVRQVSSDAPH